MSDHNADLEVQGEEVEVAIEEIQNEEQKYEETRDDEAHQGTPREERKVDELLADENQINEVTERVHEESKDEDRKSLQRDEPAVEGVENTIRDHDNSFHDDSKDLDLARISQDSISQAQKIKQYEQTLIELKEEISRLNKKLSLKSREPYPEVSEEELFKLKFMSKHANQEAAELSRKIEEINQYIEDSEIRVENLKSNSFDSELSNETLDKLNNRLIELDEELNQLSKSTNDINIEDLDRVLAPDANLKLVNEFFVNVQKRLTALETENASLTATLKKNNLETAKLKEKCENASNRYKSNDELKNKLKDLEETYLKYTAVEQKLTQDLKKAEEEFALHDLRPENKHSSTSAQSLLNELETGANNDKQTIEDLDFMLQEKRNVLRAAKVYGLQRSKTSNKLRTDMEVLGLVLVEKDQQISKLKKEIDELKLKQMQIDVEITELNEKKLLL